MTQTEKALQLIDLCARLPYGVVLDIDTTDWRAPQGHIKLKIEGTGILFRDMSLIVNGSYYGDKYKPYLRPLSSMTKKEMEELEKITYHTFKYKKGDCEIWTNSYHRVQLFNGAGELYGAGEPTNMLCSSSICIKLIDWLNAHHFDYRGLIEKGLALEAPEGMYN